MSSFTSLLHTFSLAGRHSQATYPLLDFPLALASYRLKGTSNTLFQICVTVLHVTSERNMHGNLFGDNLKKVSMHAPALVI